MGSSLGAGKEKDRPNALPPKIVGTDPDPYRLVWWPDAMLRDWAADNEDVKTLHQQMTLLRAEQAAAEAKEKRFQSRALAQAYHAKLSAERDYQVPMQLARTVPTLTNALYDAYMRLTDSAQWPPDADPFWKPKLPKTLPPLPPVPPPTRNPTRDALEQVDVMFAAYQMYRSERWGQYTDALVIYMAQRTDPFAACKDGCCERERHCDCCSDCNGFCGPTYRS